MRFTVIDDRPKPPVITDLPSLITFKAGFPDTPLDLNDFVADPDTPKSALMWASSTPLNLAIDIDPATHIVEITLSPRFLREEIVTFTVTDPENLKAEGQVQIKVLPLDPNAKQPVLVQFPSITLEAGQVSRLNLNGLASDEDPLDELIRWEAMGHQKIAISIDLNTHITSVLLAPMRRTSVDQKPLCSSRSIRTGEVPACCYAFRFKTRRIAHHRRSRSMCCPTPSSRNS